MTETNIKQPVRWEKTKENLNKFLKRLSPLRIVDKYQELLKDLFLTRNPALRFQPWSEAEWQIFFEEHLQGEDVRHAGEWFYFPWNGLAVHYLTEPAHQELRTARNRNLITPEEQDKFYNATIAIAGLSVGSHAALTITMMGGAKCLKLADPDVLSGSNLNRVRYDYTKIGESKCEIVAKYIYQINPYAELFLYSQGLSEENINEFLDGDIKPDIFVEEMDNLEMKIRSRLSAKALNIPVIMATDNGDNIIVDIERYDLDKNLQIFSGVLGDLTLEEFKNFAPVDLPKLAVKIVGPNLIVPRMLTSLEEVGKTLYSWPQLGDAATLCGVTISYLVRKIVLKEKIKSGKLEVNLDKIFGVN